LRMLEMNAKKYSKALSFLRNAQTGHPEDGDFVRYEISMARRCWDRFVKRCSRNEWDNKEEDMRDAELRVHSAYAKYVQFLEKDTDKKCRVIGEWREFTESESRNIRLCRGVLSDIELLLIGRDRQWAKGVEGSSYFSHSEERIIRIAQRDEELSVLD